MATLAFDTSKLIEVCKQNGVAGICVFGSVAPGEQDQSDIDLLVEFSNRKSLLASVALEREISTALGRKVELLTKGSASPYLRDHIMRDLRIVSISRRHHWS